MTSNYLYFSVLFLSGAMLSGAPALGAELVFEESFDAQADWTGGMHQGSPSSRLPSRGDIIPEGWSALRVDPTWAPSKGHPDRHESLEILESNADKARGRQGKSMVGWRDSYDPGWNRWNSENLMLRYLPERDEYYAEFWITFSDEMIKTYYNHGLGTSKIFRIYAFNGDREDPFKYFSEATTPDFLWGVSGGTTYGIRNKLSFIVRGADLANGDAPGMPYGLTGNGDLSLSYSYYDHIKEMAEDGRDPVLLDRLKGGTISGDVSHIDQVFGNERHWTKVAFYVRMNSSPGATDGVLMQWIDDERIFVNESIPWVRDGLNMVKWSAIGIGGNDYFNKYPNELRHEEWYAIDDFKVYDTIPFDLGGATSVLPSPPDNVEVY